MARIREVKPGVWEVTVSAGRDARTGRYGQISRHVHGTRRTANEAAAEILTELKRAGGVASKDSVGHLLDRYLEHAQTRGLAPKTLLGYELLARQAKAELGNIELRKLSAAKLDLYYAELIGRGLSATTVQHHHAFLRGALRQAVKWGWLPRSPADAASPPRSEALEPAVPTVEEVRKLLSTAQHHNPELATFLWVAVTTGMRRGEICALRWSDVDFQDSVLTVRRSISDMPGRVEARSTKTRRVRRIAIDEVTREVLLDQKDTAQRLARRVGTELDPTGYVWSQDIDHSSPWRPGRVSHSFETIRRLSGLPNVRLHHLRHFAATMMLSGGVDVRTAAGRLGHAEPSMTLKVYAHALEQRDREAAALLSGLLGAGKLSREGTA